MSARFGHKADAKTSGEKTFTRDQFIEFSEALTPLLIYSLDDNAMREFTIPIGPVTSATVRIKGPCGTKEYGSFIAQLTAFKAMIPDGLNEVMTINDAKRLFEDALKVFDE